MTVTEQPVGLRDAENRQLITLRNDRWWLPSADLELYEHPDEAVNRVLDGLTELEWDTPTLAYVESFRGRRGWHIVFHYSVRGKAAHANLRAGTGVAMPLDAGGPSSPTRGGC